MLATNELKTRAKERIKDLVEKYNAEKSAGKISHYTEAETKTGFIEPLFQALGWDTQNRNEVGLEATVSSGRADYAFKISGLVKFFVEAKAIRADLDNPEFSQQTINYAWHITEEELDESVQRILDRLIFIRTCEDRGIEEKHLISALRGRGELIPSLHRIFRDFDGIYNSKLFENHLCDKLVIDDKVLEEVIELLYHTKDQNIHYDFGAINADVLGNIYEQYLGHILKKTRSRRSSKRNTSTGKSREFTTPPVISSTT